MLVMVAYPYALIGLSKLFLLLTFMFLKIVSLFKKNMIVVIDNIDPPVETTISSSIKSPSL